MTASFRGSILIFTMGATVGSSLFCAFDALVRVHQQLSSFHLGVRLSAQSFCANMVKTKYLHTCGKNYRKDQPIISPGGRFGLFEELSSPHIAFQCIPRMYPYYDDEDCATSPSIIVDTSLTSVRLRHSSPLPDSFSLSATGIKDTELTVVVGEQLFNFSNIPVDTENYEIAMSLCHLQPRAEPYTMTCTLRLEMVNGLVEHYHSPSVRLSYVPGSTISGSMTKMDRKTGALLVKSKANAQTFEPIFPIGFYTDFEYLVSNITVLDELKSQGFNTIHPVPPFHGEKEGILNLNALLDRMDEIGLYLMYDMRHSYQNLDTLTQEVEVIKNRKCLLLWYTADEPDGWGDPLSATTEAYNAISQLDIYHPVSIALNCADHFFEEYVSGADIVMPDVYTIGNNATFSSKYDTPCTADFGCCGCDNCEGQLEDISRRLDNTKDRLRFLGWNRTKFIWAVTQAFGGEEFWTRAPTGREWLVQAILSINHGARGIIPWIDPTPTDIKQLASNFAKILPQLTPYFFDEHVVFSHSNVGRVDIGRWKRRNSDVLVLATNLDDASSSDSLLRMDNLNDASEQITTWILNEGASKDVDGTLTLEPLGSAIYVVKTAKKTSDFGRHDEL